MEENNHIQCFEMRTYAFDVESMLIGLNHLSWTLLTFSKQSFLPLNYTYFHRRQSPGLLTSRL